MQTPAPPPTPSSEEPVRPPGVLRVGYSLNCGACGMFTNRIPDPKIKNWEDLLLSVTDGLWSWRLTKKFGWVCGCQEINKRRQEEEQAIAQQRALSRQDDDLPF